MKIHDITPRNLYLCSEFDEFALKTEDIDFSLEDLVSLVVLQSDVYYWLNVESVWGRMGFIWDNELRGRGHFSTKTVPYSVIPKLPDGDRIHTFQDLFDYNTYDELTFLSSDWSNVGVHNGTFDFQWTTDSNKITKLTFSLDNINLDRLSNKTIGFSLYLNIKNITDELRELLRDKVLVFYNANNNSPQILTYSKEDPLKLPSFFITIQTGLSDFYIDDSSSGTAYDLWTNLDEVSTMDYWGIYNTIVALPTSASSIVCCKFTLKPLYLPKTNYTSLTYTYPCIGDKDNVFTRPIKQVIDLSKFNTYVPDFSTTRSLSYVCRKFINGFPKYLSYGFDDLDIKKGSITYWSLDDNLDIVESELTEEEFNKYWKACVDSINYVANSNSNKFVIRVDKLGELTEEDYLQIAKYQRQLFCKNISVQGHYNEIYRPYLFPYVIDMKDKIRFDMFYTYKTDRLSEYSDVISPVYLVVKLSNLNLNNLSRNILIFSNKILSYNYSLIAPISENKVTVNVLSPGDIVYYNIIAIDNSIKYKIDSNSYPSDSSNSTRWYILLTDTVPEYTFDYSDYVVEINLLDLLDAPNPTSFIFLLLVFKDGIYNNNLVKFYEDRDTLFLEVENIHNLKNDRISINTLGNSPIRTVGDYHWGLKETYAPVILLNISSTGCTAVVHDWCYLANSSIVFDYKNNEFFDFESFINALLLIPEDSSTLKSISMNTEFYQTFSLELIAQITAKGYTVIERI